MTAPKPATLARRWAKDDADLEVVATDPLEVASAGVDVTVHAEPEGFDGLVLEHRVDLPTHTFEGLGEDDDEREGVLAALVAQVVTARSGLLDGTADGRSIRLLHPVHAEGLTRHAFATAVAEVVKARRSLGAALTARAVEGSVDVRDLFREAQASPEPAPTAEIWAPTHVVPAGGLPAYDEADPSRMPVAQLAAGVRLRLVREWGAWAEVLGENGWRGWVDGRRLPRLG